MAPIPTFESSIPSVRDSITSLASSLSPRSPSPIPALSRTIAAGLLRLTGRQSNPSIIPTTYGNSNNSLQPGTIVGIVLGSVGGFLLILWLIYTCLNLSTPDRSSYTESVVVRDHRRSRHGSQSRRVETVEVRNRSRTPVRIVREEPRPHTTERVVVEEVRETRQDNRSRADSDEVVVIEEHSPPRRPRSKRESREYRRESGYRTVDPLAYGGAVGGRSDRRSRRS